MERTVDERKILRPWDIVERNPGVSPVCRIRDGGTSAQGGPLCIIHVRQESKGTFDEVVWHRVRVLSTNTPTAVTFSKVTGKRALLFGDSGPSIDLLLMYLALVGPMNLRVTQVEFGVGLAI